MATSTKNTTKTPVDPAKSAAAKKAAATRKANREAKLVKEQEAAALVEQQALEALKQPERKISDVICEVLLLKDENEKGFDYNTCLSLVLEQIHDDAKTSLSCLRWYANKMRSEGVILPHRPRNVPRRKVVDPTA